MDNYTGIMTYTLKDSEHQIFIHCKQEPNSEELMDFLEGGAVLRHIDQETGGFNIFRVSEIAHVGYNPFEEE